MPGYAANPVDRCALCKTELMAVAGPIAARLGGPVALGTNVDDLGDHRPGVAAPAPAASSATTLRGAASQVSAAIATSRPRPVAREVTPTSGRAGPAPG